MALPFVLTFTIRDADGERSTVGFNMPSTLTDETARELSMATLVGAVDDLVHGVIENVSYSRPLTPAGLKTAPAGQNDRLIGGRFLMVSAEGHESKVTLPTFDTASNVVNGAEGINDTAAVLALKTILEGGSVATAHDEPIVDVYDQYETFGGKR